MHSSRGSVICLSFFNLESWTEQEAGLNSLNGPFQPYHFMNGEKKSAVAAESAITHRETLVIMRYDWSHSNWIQIYFLFTAHRLTICPKREYKDQGRTWTYTTTTPKLLFLFTIFGVYHSLSKILAQYWRINLVEKFWDRINCTAPFPLPPIKLETIPNPNTDI